LAVMPMPRFTSALLITFVLASSAQARDLGPTAPVRPTATPRTAEQRAGDSLNGRDFGAVGDGGRHPLSDRFSTLQSARAFCPKADALDVEIDWCAIQSAIDYGRPVLLPDGIYVVNRTLFWGVSGPSLRGAQRGAVQIRRYGDYGPTIRIGGSPTPVFGSRVSGLALYDFGSSTHESMTQTRSPFHIVADNTIGLALDDLLIANAGGPSDGGGMKILGGIDYQITRSTVSLQNGRPDGKIGILIGRSALTNVSGGGKTQIDQVNIEGGILAYQNGSAVALTAHLDEGLRVEAGDGLWISNFHVQGARLADMHLATTTGADLGNVYATNMMLDITNGHGLLADGDGRVERVDISGRISASSLGPDDRNGVRWTATTRDATLDIGVDGFKGDLIVWDAPASSDIVIRPRVLRRGRGGGIDLRAGHRFVVQGGQIGGDGSLGFAIRAGSGLYGLAVSGVSIADLRPGGLGYIFEPGAKDISVSGGLISGVSRPLIDRSASTARLKVRGVLGTDDLTKP
jgi:hypothetical protein